MGYACWVNAAPSPVDSPEAASTESRLAGPLSILSLSNKSSKVSYTSESPDSMALSRPLNSA
jgi:hypothetical protein